MKFHHVGVACSNIEEELERIRNIHTIQYQSPIVFDLEQNATLCLLTTSNGFNIELISGKQVEIMLKKKITYYHICFEVDNLDDEIKRLQEKNAFLISPPKPAILFNNRKVAFLSVSYGIIELLSSS